MSQTRTNPSIIETIDKMVKDGESEEKILSTLKDIGISPDNARRLLILGQADVFSLLKGEIKKNIKQEFEREEPELKKITHEETSVSLEEVKQQISKTIMNEVKEYEKNLASQNKALSDQLLQRIEKINELEEKAKTNLASQNKALQDQILTNLREYEKNLTNQNNAMQQQLNARLQKVSEMPEKTKQEILSQNKAVIDQLNARLQRINEMPEKTKQEILNLNRSYQDQLNAKIDKISDMPEKLRQELLSQNKAMQDQLNAKMQKLSEVPEKTRQELLSQNKAMQDQMMAKLREYENNLASQNNAVQQLSARSQKSPDLPGKAEAGTAKP